LPVRRRRLNVKKKLGKVKTRGKIMSPGRYQKDIRIVWRKALAKKRRSLKEEKKAIRKEASKGGANWKENNVQRKFQKCTAGVGEMQL